MSFFITGRCGNVLREESRSFVDLEKLLRASKSIFIIFLGLRSSYFVILFRAFKKDKFTLGATKVLKIFVA